MRFLAVILSLYIFYLISLPCADVNDDCSIVKTEQANHGNSSDEHGDMHLCSPFCICSCCHVNVMVCFWEGLTAPLIQLTEEHNVFYSSLLPEFYSTFWQPPKIS